MGPGLTAFTLLLLRRRLLTPKVPDGRGLPPDNSRDSPFLPNPWDGRPTEPDVRAEGIPCLHSCLQRFSPRLVIVRLADPSARLCFFHFFFRSPRPLGHMRPSGLLRCQASPFRPELDGLDVSSVACALQAFGHAFPAPNASSPAASSASAVTPLPEPRSPFLPCRPRLSLEEAQDGSGARGTSGTFEHEDRR